MNAAEPRRNGPRCGIDFVADDVLRDPYPAYEAQRRSAPLAYDESEDAWLVFGYDLMRRMTKTNALSAAADMSFVDLLPQGDRPAAELLGEHYKSWMLFSDGDRHNRLRSTIAPLIGAPWVNELRRDLAQRLSGQLQRASGDLDVVVDYVMPVAQWALARAFGLNEEPLRSASTWCAELLEFINVDITRPQALRTAAAIREMQSFAAKLECLKPRRHSGGEGIVAALHDGRLTAGDVTGVVGQFVTGFLGALPYLIANGAIGLWRYAAGHPEDTVARLDLKVLTEEVIRYDPTFLVVARTATTNIEIDDCPAIHRGERIGYMLGSVNRDESFFTRAALFDAHRRGSPHMSFGLGTHYCLGSHLTRTFVTEAFKALMASYNPWRSVLAPVRFEPYFGLRMAKQVVISASQRPTAVAGS